ncbi:MAG: hypothetical protein IT372_26530 [Polyangiaceae bacterium]|nr:hypothetical protein [Polyangiaceae bacterium]
MRPSLSLALPLLLAALALGCAGNTSAAAPQVRVRAAYDLDCPDDEIRLEEELGGWYKAVGCGRKARYRTACDALSCVVNGEDEPAIPWRDRPDPAAPRW